jgi:hypothetical protein
MVGSLAVIFGLLNLKASVLTTVGHCLREAQAQGRLARYTLGNPITMRSWSINGLPADNLSMENGIILTKARRWGLMIDPQAQANRWIKTMFKDNLDIVKPTNKDLIRRIEAGIRAGEPLSIKKTQIKIPKISPPGVQCRLRLDMAVQPASFQI